MGGGDGGDWLGFDIRVWILDKGPPIIPNIDKEEVPPKLRTPSLHRTLGKMCSDPEGGCDGESPEQQGGSTTWTLKKKPCK